MNKLFQAFLTGIFFTFILDFFLFLGIFQNYIKFYEINLYYNILFADNQCWLIYSFLSIVIGYIVIYFDNNRVSAVVLGFLFFTVSLTLFSPIGQSVGEMFFMQKNTLLQDAKHTFKGDIYYNGRENITFYDYDLQRTILLQKKDLK